MARKLADLYAGQMIASADDVTRSNEILEKIQELIRSVPSADTPALKVMLLQADYNQAENLASQWIADPSITDARKAAGEILNRITPELNEYQLELIGSVNAQIDALNDLEEGDQRERIEKDLLCSFLDDKIEVIRKVQASNKTSHHLAIIFLFQAEWRQGPEGSPCIP